jgi:hypothetical protein
VQREEVQPHGQRDGVGIEREVEGERLRPFGLGHDEAPGSGAVRRLPEDERDVVRGDREHVRAKSQQGAAITELPVPKLVS